MSDKSKPIVRNNTLLAVVICIFMICVTIEVVNNSNNRRATEIESLKIEKQHELEVTKQKAILHDKGRKRKIWEREMTPESE